MYFTIIFEDNKEGPSLSFDLAFHPCPVWYQGNDQIGIPNQKNPGYELGSVSYLIKILEGDFNMTKYKNVKIVTHQNGHGTKNDKELLVEDLKNEGFTAICL